MPDNINDNLVPIDKKLFILLWQQTSNGADPKWLAYKDISSHGSFSDNVESGDNGWRTSGLWHMSTCRSHSATHSWHYARQVFCPGSFDTGATNTGTLVSPPINLCEATNATLNFWSWYQTENVVPYDPNSFDKKFVDVSTDDGTSWDNGVFQLLLPANPMNTWQQIHVNLSAYTGQTIRIRFRFDSIDETYNNYEGWYIDDVTVTGNFAFPINEATLLVRVIESASITFTNGRTAEIVDGDIVVGSISSARGTVNDTPILSGGSWAGNNAAGTMLLANVNGTFQNGEGVTVIGSSALATATGFTPRANYIRAYYGDTGGCGNPNDNPLDDEKHGNPRNTDPANVNVYWPPNEVGNWAAENDYFTLVQWDAINTAVMKTDNPAERSVERVPSADEPNAIIESTEPVLFTPTSGPFVQAELGLHTFGKGSLNVYFDDFALQTKVRSTGGFLPAIQE